MPDKTFSELLTQYYLNWQAEQGSRKTIEDFADHIGCSQPLVSMWINGKRKPGPEYTDRLAELIGPEIYDSLGLPRRDPLLTYIKRNWSKLPPETQHQIHEQISDYMQNQQKTKPFQNAKTTT